MGGGVVFINLNETPEGKMASCKFRSKNKVNKEIKKCCGKKNMEYAFECPKRGIFPLNQSTCNSCGLYESL